MFAHHLSNKRVRLARFIALNMFCRCSTHKPLPPPPLIGQDFYLRNPVLSSNNILYRFCRISRLMVSLDSMVCRTRFQTLPSKLNSTKHLSEFKRNFWFILVIYSWSNLFQFFFRDSQHLILQMGFSWSTFSSQSLLMSLICSFTGKCWHCFWEGARWHQHKPGQGSLHCGSSRDTVRLRAQRRGKPE